MSATACEKENWRTGSRCVLPAGHANWHTNGTNESWSRHDNFDVNDYPDPEAVKALQDLVDEFGNTVGSMGSSDWDGQELIGDFLEKYEVRRR
ncbi:hypothetical protein KNU13_gp08 [Gordonia phage Turuncu]|uniref:Uncharacterized protein n=1 Tax=Gordonia phage Turuncu TaxID=2315610 RepID=A0A386KCV7_9CAUD|nr:hypothetical protein KNU13_gp08 [Gordonia phage Turuncu]AYD82096.1 hypothetical protein SEA_TURUNCU_8 [Gordonia phage Turuncu]